MKRVSFVEVMTLLAILGILASIGIPLYRDHSVRGKVTSVVESLGPVTNAVAEFHLRTGRWPKDSAEAGIDGDTGLEYVKTVAWSLNKTRLVLFTKNLGWSTVDGQELVLAAKLSKDGRRVTWDCRPSDSMRPLPLDMKYLPPDCRR